MLKNKKLRISVIIILCFCAGIAVLTAAINIRICTFADKRILTEEEAKNLSDVDCILVLGCGVREDGTPSHMLEDRLKRGVSLYENGVAPKLLMSGDHGQDDYDEVNAMKAYALDAGIPTADIFMDHAGFSTYESMYRAKEIFQAEKIVIVTQQYHLYRAVYIAEQLGLEAYGVNCDYRTYSGQFMRDVREVLARVKDFGMCIIKPEPTYMGEVIPVQGDGTLTDDK
ncbi:MAG: YdcF family protein [Clostridia bacterium]|nr:YdcF family protein [Clostridia bacterium]